MTGEQCGREEVGSQFTYENNMLFLQNEMTLPDSFQCDSAIQQLLPANPNELDRAARIRLETGLLGT